MFLVHMVALSDDLMLLNLVYVVQLSFGTQIFLSTGTVKFIVENELQLLTTLEPIMK